MHRFAAVQLTYERKQLEKKERVRLAPMSTRFPIKQI